MVKFISRDNPYRFFSYRQLDYPIRNIREFHSGIQFIKGVYETDNEDEIKALRKYIRSFKSVLPPIYEEGQAEGGRPTFDEYALENETKSREREREIQERIDRITKLFN